MAIITKEYTPGNTAITSNEIDKIILSARRDAALITMAALMDAAEGNGKINPKFDIE